MYQISNIKSDLVSLYIILAWEPSVAQATKKYFRRLPALERFYRERKFQPIDPAVWPAIADIYIFIQTYMYIYERRALIYRKI